jgi:hypothetical protein
MDTVHGILKAFEGPTNLAKAMGLSVQTVWEWGQGKPEIPPWRRPAVLQAAEEQSIPLEPEQIAYLQSSVRGRAQQDAA